MQQTPARGGVGVKPPIFTCPLCYSRRLASKAYCTNCQWGIDKMQNLSRQALKAKMLMLIRDLKLCRAALA
jgi:hypothetical protein